jgi:hypothetical protein
MLHAATPFLLNFTVAPSGDKPFRSNVPDRIIGLRTGLIIGGAGSPAPVPSQSEIMPF